MTTSQQIARIIRNRQAQGFSPRAIAHQIEKELNKESKMNTIEITCRQASYSRYGKHFGYRTNTGHVISAIEIGGIIHHYEILVFDEFGESDNPILVSTVDEMIKRFSELVAEYTLEGTLA